MVSTVSTALKEAPARSRGLHRYIGNIRRAVTSTFEGMSVTASWMFRRPMTVQYPDRVEKPVQEMLPEGYRGILEVDVERCTGCMLCGKACPIGAIDIEVQKNPETGERELTRFDIDMGLCMYCGLCCEACNFDSIIHTQEFEGTVGSPDDLVLHFIREPRSVSKHKSGQGPERRPQGSILPEVVPTYGKRRAHRPPSRPASNQAERGEHSTGEAAEPSGGAGGGDTTGGQRETP